MRHNAVFIFTDGGSRGNPGPSACAFVVFDANKTPIYKRGIYLGLSTNNVAEYQGIVHALRWVKKNKKDFLQKSSIYINMDSQLAYSQLVGLYKIKNARLRELLFLIRELEAGISADIHYAHIPREQNKVADILVNQTLNNEKNTHSFY